MLSKPFLKWAGGKFRLLPRILPVLPQGKRLVEPFSGSGAVFLNADYPAFLICDINPDLIGLFQTLQREGAAFLHYCQSFFTTANNTPEAFLALRESFNTTGEEERRAALFLYLNRHAYNGLVRYNRSGRYNVPFGKYKAPYFPEQELRFFLEKNARCDIRFLVADFVQTFKMLCPGDVVYADPPYAPLPDTASFTSYASSPFGDREQKLLAEAANNAASRGYSVVISNHDTPFTRRIYEGALVQDFDVQRFISCKGQHRKPAPELLAIFHKPQSGLPRFMFGSENFSWPEGTLTSAERALF